MTAAIIALLSARILPPAKCHKPSYPHAFGKPPKATATGRWLDAPSHRVSILRSSSLRRKAGRLRRFHGVVSVAFPIDLGFHTRTIGESDASIDRRHAHRRLLWHNFRCNRTQSEELAGDAAQP